MGKRAPTGFFAYLSLEQNPYAEGGTGFAQAAGNLAEFSPAGNAWQVNVLNDTCAQYYLRVVLTYPDAGTTTMGPCGSAAQDAGK
jgi:hypothetical protein